MLQKRTRRSAASPASNKEDLPPMGFQLLLQAPGNPAQAAHRIKLAVHIVGVQDRDPECLRRHALLILGIEVG